LKNKKENINIIPRISLKINSMDEFYIILKSIKLYIETTGNADAEHLYKRISTKYSNVLSVDS
jgi:hypothetical protein